MNPKPPSYEWVKVLCKYLSVIVDDGVITHKGNADGILLKTSIFVGLFKVGLETQDKHISPTFWR